MRSLIVVLFCITLGLGCSTDIQTSPRPEETIPKDQPIRGIPFKVDPDVSVSGWYFNTNNNGQQDYGEYAVDRGGAGNIYKPPTLADLSFQIIATDNVSFNYFGIPHHYIQERMIFNEMFEAIVLRPNLDSPPPGGWQNTNVGTVIHRSTRASHTMHQPILSNEFNAFQLPINTRGATTITFKDELGGQPMIRSAHNSAKGGLYLRGVLGLDTILSMGGSYGAGVAFLDAVLNCDIFDAVSGAGGILSLQSYAEWHEAFAIMRGAIGHQIFWSRHNPGPQQLTTLLGQFNIDPLSFDLKEHSETVCTPLQHFFGSGDWVDSGTNAKPTIEAIANKGINWIKVHDWLEAGHGDPLHTLTTSTGLTTEDGIDELIGLANQFKGQTLGAPIPLTRAVPPRRGYYDSLLLSERVIGRTPASTERFSDLWTRKGYGINAAHGEENGAIYFSETENKSYLFYPTLEGIRKRVWDPQTGSISEDEVFSSGVAPSGLIVDSLEPGGPARVIATTYRGLEIFDLNGQKIRETTKYRDTTAPYVADLFAKHPGKEIVYLGEESYLVIESALSGDIIVETQIGQASQFLSAPDPNDANHHHLYVAFEAMGHIGRFRWNRSFSRKLTPVLDWMSQYAELQIKRFAFIPGTNPQRHIILGGIERNENRFPNSPVLRVLDKEGLVSQDIPTGLRNIHGFYANDQASVFAAGLGGIEQIDLESGSANSLLSASSALVGPILSSQSKDFALFGAQGQKIKIVDQSLSVQETVSGFKPTTAVDVFQNPNTGLWEISVYDRDHKVRTYNPQGVLLASVSATDWKQGASGFSSPRHIKRIGNDASDLSSFEPFFIKGDFITVTPPGFPAPLNLRMSALCGRLVFSAASSFHSTMNQLLTLPPISDCVASYLGREDPVTKITPEPGTVGISDAYFSTTRSTKETVSLETVNLAGENFAALGTPAGRAFLFSIDNPTLVPLEITGIAPSVTGFAAGDITGNGKDNLIITTFEPDTDGNTVFIFEEDLANQRLTRVSAFPAELPTGVYILNSTPTGGIKFLIGTSGGRLFGYNASFHRIYEETDENVGVFGNNQVKSFTTSGPNPETFIVYPTSQSIRIRKVL